MTAFQVWKSNLFVNWGHGACCICCSVYGLTSRNTWTFLLKMLHLTLACLMLLSQVACCRGSRLLQLTLFEFLYARVRLLEQLSIDNVFSQVAKFIGCRTYAISPTIMKNINMIILWSISWWQILIHLHRIFGWLDLMGNLELGRIRTWALHSLSMMKISYSSCFSSINWGKMQL